jgi:hypothetical protein
MLPPRLVINDKMGETLGWQRTQRRYCIQIVLSEKSSGKLLISWISIGRESREGKETKDGSLERNTNEK